MLFNNKVSSPEKNARKFILSRTFKSVIGECTEDMLDELIHFFTNFTKDSITHNNVNTICLLLHHRKTNLYENWVALSKVAHPSIDYFICLYGSILGTQKYNQRCEKCGPRHRSHTENFLKRSKLTVSDAVIRELNYLYENWESLNVSRPIEWDKAVTEFIHYGLTGYYDRILSMKTVTRLSLPWYILRCGDIMGPIRYAENYEKTTVNFRKTHGSEQQRARAVKANAQKTKLGDCNPTTVTYWMNRHNMNLQDATIAVSNRQRTFSKELCIMRYGESLGLVKWAQRQATWLASLKSSGLYSKPSKVSIRLFDEIKKECPGIIYGTDEITIPVNNHAYSVDCCDPSSKKIIEFYGDYWHANPAKYAPTHKIKNKFAFDIWEHDKSRQDLLIEAGYSVLVIWNHEYTTAPADVIARCVTFLKS